MKTPLELLKSELELRKLIANQRGFSHNKTKSKKMIPLYEKAITVLELNQAEVIKSVCDHNYVYKILFDHTAADICTKCGNIKKQTVL